MYLFNISRLCKIWALTEKYVDKEDSQKTIKTQNESTDHLEISGNKQTIVIYNLMLPNLNEITNKHWHILNINPDYDVTFKTPPIIPFRKNVCLKQIIGTNNRINKNSETQQTTSLKESVHTHTICCKQVNTTETFTSNQRN